MRGGIKRKKTREEDIDYTREIQWAIERVIEEFIERKRNCERETKKRENKSDRKKEWEGEKEILRGHKGKMEEKVRMGGASDFEKEKNVIERRTSTWGIEWAREIEWGVREFKRDRGIKNWNSEARKGSKTERGLKRVREESKERERSGERKREKLRERNKGWEHKTEKAEEQGKEVKREIEKLGVEREINPT